MSSRTKSVDDPPTCRPTLAPPIENMAGADHLPSNFSPRRQSKGPRPPLPPTPKPNFLTPGRISTHSAFDKRDGEMELLLSMSWSTRLAFRRVSSSFCLSAANAGVSSRTIMEPKRQGKPNLEPRLVFFLSVIRSIGCFSFRQRLRSHGCLNVGRWTFASAHRSLSSFSLSVVTTTYSQIDWLEWPL